MTCVYFGLYFLNYFAINNTTQSENYNSQMWDTSWFRMFGVDKKFVLVLNNSFFILKKVSIPFLWLVNLYILPQSQP